MISEIGKLVNSNSRGLCNKNITINNIYNKIIIIKIILILIIIIIILIVGRQKFIKFIDIKKETRAKDGALENFKVNRTVRLQQGIA